MFTFLYFVTCQEPDSEDGSEDGSLSEIVQSHIKKDSITIEIVEDLFKADLSSALRFMLSVSLNSLLLTNEILASSMSQDDELNFEVPLARDVLQSELSTLYSRLDRNEKTFIREEYERRLNFIKIWLIYPLVPISTRTILLPKGVKRDSWINLSWMRLYQV